MYTLKMCTSVYAFFLLCIISCGYCKFVPESGTAVIIKFFLCSRHDSYSKCSHAPLILLNVLNIQLKISGEL